MSTHQLREAIELATHIALIRKGQLAYAGERRQEMLDDPDVAVSHVRGRKQRRESVSCASAFTIAAKDLRAEWRTKEALNASLAFPP